MMRAVVSYGTGTQAQSSIATVNGKTGTAEVGPDTKSDAWFVGYAPAEAPKVVVSVLIVHGGVGGTVAAPLARQMIEAASTGKPGGIVGHGGRAARRLAADRGSPRRWKLQPAGIELAILTNTTGRTRAAIAERLAAIGFEFAPAGSSPPPLLRPSTSAAPQPSALYARSRTAPPATGRHRAGRAPGRRRGGAGGPMRPGLPAVQTPSSGCCWRERRWSRCSATW